MEQICTTVQEYGRAHPEIEVVDAFPAMWGAICAFLAPMPPEQQDHVLNALEVALPSLRADLAARRKGRPQ